MDSIVLEQVDKVINVHEGVIDLHNSGFAGILGERSSSDETSDSAESIDSNSSDRHMIKVFLVDFNTLPD